MKLVPKEITLSSQYKCFGLDAGESSGSFVGVTFSVANMDSDDLEREIMIQKLTLDILVLQMEYERGSFPKKRHYREKLSKLEEALTSYQEGTDEAR